MKELNLDRLDEEIEGISVTRAAFYREAIIVGLKKQGHESGTEMMVSGNFEKRFTVVWEKDINVATLASWKDENQIANFGAVGIAILLAIELLGIVSFEEGIIGTGIDFWVSTKSSSSQLIPFINREARIEVSGILQENLGNTVNMRVGQKKKQMKSSDHSQLPGWVIVVEFSTPKTKIVRK